MYCHVAARALDGARRVSHRAASTSLSSVHARPLRHSKKPLLRSQGTSCIDRHVGGALNVYQWPRRLNRRGHWDGVVTRVEAAESNGAPHPEDGRAGDGDAQFDDDNSVSEFEGEDGAEVRDGSGAAEHSASLHPGYYRRDASDPRGSWEERVREMPGFVPGGPPLERSVFQSLEDWSPATPPSARDMAYWFTEPQGGWGSPTERAWVPAPQPEEEHRGDLARHVDGRGRRVVEELVVGEVLRGKVVGHHLRLGVQVDVGAEYDALLAINDVDFTGEHARWGGRESDQRVDGFGGVGSEVEAGEQQEPSTSSHASSTPPHAVPLDLQPQVELGPWEEVQRALPLGMRVEVEVVALRLTRVSDRCLFRFPVQALPRDAGLRGLFPPAEEHRAPCDWRGLGLQSLEEMVRLSGRTAQPIQTWEKSVRTRRVERALGHSVPDPETPGSLALWTGEALEAWEAQHREALQRKPWLREALRDPEVKRRLEEHFLGEDAPTAEGVGLDEGQEDALAACGIASVSLLTEAAWDEEFSDEE